MSDELAKRIVRRLVKTEASKQDIAAYCEAHGIVLEHYQDGLIIGDLPQNVDFVELRRVLGISPDSLIVNIPLVKDDCTDPMCFDDYPPA